MDKYDTWIDLPGQDFKIWSPQQNGYCQTLSIWRSKQASKDVSIVQSWCHHKHRLILSFTWETDRSLELYFDFDASKSVRSMSTYIDMKHTYLLTYVTLDRAVSFLHDTYPLLDNLNLLWRGQKNQSIGNHTCMTITLDSYRMPVHYNHLSDSVLPSALDSTFPSPFHSHPSPFGMCVCLCLV